MEGLLSRSFPTKKKIKKIDEIMLSSLYRIKEPWSLEE